MCHRGACILGFAISAVRRACSKNTATAYDTVTFTVLDIRRISSYDASYYVEISAIDDGSIGPSKVYAL